MNNTLAEQISTTIEARENCERLNNTEWHARHEQTLEELADLLPSGSGIDTGTKIDLDESKPDKLVLTFSYHHMDDCGGYDGWTDHSVIVTPALRGQFRLRITGRNRNDVKEYLYQVYEDALRQTVEFDNDKRAYFLPSIREAARKFQAGVASGEII